MNYRDLYDSILVTKKYKMTLFDYLKSNPSLEISKRLKTEKNCENLKEVCIIGKV